MPLPNKWGFGADGLSARGLTAALGALAIHLWADVAIGAALRHAVNPPERIPGIAALLLVLLLNSINVFSCLFCFQDYRYSVCYLSQRFANGIC